MISIEAQIEAILFFKNEPVSFSELAATLSLSEDAIRASVAKLQEQLHERGIVLMQHDNNVTLGTHPDVSETIEALRSAELKKDLGKAGLETLTIIVYLGPISRADIDYIRGVNSQFIIRHLLIRGLIERIPHPTDKRILLYQTTFDTLSFLGVSNVEEIPEYVAIRKKIETIQKEQSERMGDTQTNIAKENITEE